VSAVLLLIQFSSDTSTYQRIKLVVLSLLPLTKDAIHVYVGCACLLATASLLRWPLSSVKVLLPGLVLSLAMEVVDLRDGWRQHKPHWAGSIHDLVNTNLIPAAIVVLARKRRLRVVTP
jgi:hypothetical protein